MFVLGIVLMAAGVAVAWLSPAVTVSTPTSLDVNATATYTATADPEQAERLQLVEFTLPKNTDLSVATLTVQQGATILPPPIATNTTVTATSIQYGATYDFELANEASPPSVAITLSGVGNPSQPGSYQYSVSALSSSRNRSRVRTTFELHREQRAAERGRGHAERPPARCGERVLARAGCWSAR